MRGNGALITFVKTLDEERSRHSILQSGEDDTGAVPPIPVDEVRHLGSDVVARAGDHRGGDRRR